MQKMIIEFLVFNLLIMVTEVHNVNFLKNIKQQVCDCVLLVDRGCLSKSIQLDLFQTINIKLDPSQRRIGEANAE